MTDDIQTDDAPKKDLRALADAMARGKDYRQDHDTEVFGVPLTLVLRPVPDKEYIPILGYMDETFGLSEEEAKEEIEEALEEADYQAEDVDLSKFDAEFIELMEGVCQLGIDPAAMDGDEELLEEIFQNTVGGYALEWGWEIMEVTGTLRDAKRFRGGRNRS